MCVKLVIYKEKVWPFISFQPRRCRKNRLLGIHQTGLFVCEFPGRIHL